MFHASEVNMHMMPCSHVIASCILVLQFSCSLITIKSSPCIFTVAVFIICLRYNKVQKELNAKDANYALRLLIQAPFQNNFNFSRRHLSPNCSPCLNCVTNCCMCECLTPAVTARVRRTWKSLKSIYLF